MCPIRGKEFDRVWFDDIVPYCEACDAEALAKASGQYVKINMAYHSCPKAGGFFFNGVTYSMEDLEKVGSDLGQMEMRESTRPMGGTVGTYRYALTELWPYHKRIKPINQLSTPHLRNIVELFRDGNKLAQVREQEDQEEYRQLRARLTHVRQELERRDNSMKDRVHNMSIRCDGMAHKVYTNYVMQLDMHEVYSVFKSAAQLLSEVEATLAKTD